MLSSKCAYPTGRVGQASPSARVLKRQGEVVVSLASSIGSLAAQIEVFLVLGSLFSILALLLA